MSSEQVGLESSEFDDGQQKLSINGVPVAEPPNFKNFSWLIFLLCDGVKVLQYGGLFKSV